jgi:hypothetical protein
MSLVVDTKNAPTIRGESIYAAGITLMSIGLSRINESNQNDAQRRIDFINALDNFRTGKNTISFKGQDLIGVSANVRSETQKAWAKRITEGFFRN